MGVDRTWGPGDQGTRGQLPHHSAPSVLPSAPMPYLIGVHSSLTEVSGCGQGPQGWVELPPLCTPRCPPCQGSSGSEHGTPNHPPSQRVLEKGLEDVVMMNVDSNILETPFDDVQALPPDVVSVTPPATAGRQRPQIYRLSATPLSSRCPC